MSVSTVVTEGFSTGTSLGRTWFVVTGGYGQLFVVETADSVITLLGTISQDGVSVRGEIDLSKTILSGVITDSVGVEGTITANGVSGRCKIDSIVVALSGAIDETLSIIGEIDETGFSSRGKISTKPTNLEGKI